MVVFRPNISTQMTHLADLCVSYSGFRIGLAWVWCRRKRTGTTRMSLPGRASRRAVCWTPPPRPGAARGPRSTSSARPDAPPCSTHVRQPMQNKEGANIPDSHKGRTVMCTVYAGLDLGDSEASLDPMRQSIIMSLSSADRSVLTSDVLWCSVWQPRGRRCRVRRSTTTRASSPAPPSSALTGSTT